MLKQITPTELKVRLDNGEDILVVDVREDWELKISNLDFAQHIVMSDIPRRSDEIPEDKTIVFVCRSEARSAQVAQFLTMNGWEEDNLINLRGGILAWAREVDPSMPDNY